MPSNDYSYFFRELPHLLLTVVIGMLNIFIFLPLISFLYFQPGNYDDILLIISMFWNNIVFGSQVNWFFTIIIFLVCGYAIGCIFASLYDLIGSNLIYKILTILVKLGKRTYIKIKDINETQLKKKEPNFIFWFRKINAYKKYAKNNFRFGSEAYSEYQFKLYSPNNLHMKSYHSWEFLKQVFCSYLLFIIIIFGIVFVLFYPITQILDISVVYSVKSILLFVLIFIVSFFFIIVWNTVLWKRKICFRGKLF